MTTLAIAPGPKIGKVLEVLLQEVIDNPAKNNKEALTARVLDLGGLSDEELTQMAEKAESAVEMREDEREGGIKAKYWVK